MYIHVYTWYVHGMYILMYKRVCTSFRRVRTCSYNSEHVLNYTNMYIQYTNLYIESLSVVQPMFSVQMATYIS